MGDAESLSVSSLSISDGVTGSGTSTSALGKRQKYILKDKASDAEQQEAHSIPFVECMIDLYQSPNDHKEWKKTFNATC